VNLNIEGVDDESGLDAPRLDKQSSLTLQKTIFQISNSTEISQDGGILEQDEIEEMISPLAQEMLSPLAQTLSTGVENLFFVKLRMIAYLNAVHLNHFHHQLLQYSNSRRPRFSW
jgi:hypothetical protein